MSKINSVNLKVIGPNGHGELAPLNPESFDIGVAASPDYIAAISGSDDIGPGPLNSDISTSPGRWRTDDWQEVLLASRRLEAPMSHFCSYFAQRGEA